MLAPDPRGGPAGRQHRPEPPGPGPDLAAEDGAGPDPRPDRPGPGDGPGPAPAAAGSRSSQDARVAPPGHLRGLADQPGDPQPAGQRDPGGRGGRPREGGRIEVTTRRRRATTYAHRDRRQRLRDRPARRSPGCSTRSSPPSASARGPAWASRSATGSSPATAAGSRSRARPARGTTFRILLPLKPPDAPSRARPPTRPRNRTDA